MQTVKLVSHATLLPAASASVKATRLSLARSQSTLFPTRLALARWTAGGDVPHLHSNASAPLRAAWFTRVQRDFQAWLDSGGFVQHDDDDAAEAVDAGAQPGAARLRIVRPDGNAV
ncbi:MAG: hypothetical protein JWP72_2800 [Massilia sp.]|nr:hypothetical protein [Massilia sp.]MDB5791407.1 hypothetical protein [Massilia sp.]